MSSKAPLFFSTGRLLPTSHSRFDGRIPKTEKSPRLGSRSVRKNLLEHRQGRSRTQIRCRSVTYLFQRNHSLQPNETNRWRFSGVQDTQYTEQSLLEQLELCAEHLDRAERYECLGELYRLIIPQYEKARNYTALAQAYQTLSKAYHKVTEVNRSRKRLLGRYYRVVFHGQVN